jgi:hypothetical protein
MTLTRTVEERRAIELADKVKRRESQARAQARAATRQNGAAARKEAPTPNQRDPRQVEKAFVSWLHEDLPCIGCLIEGPGPVGYATIEAAHQKMSIADKGWGKAGLGPRTHDHRCVPLCSWHHRLAANSCDTGGQKKFWARLGIFDDVADFCRDLFDAFKQGNAGRAVVLAFAAAGRARLASESSPNETPPNARSDR